MHAWKLPIMMPFSIGCGPNVAINDMKNKLAQAQDIVIVQQRNAPNTAKKRTVQRNNGSEASIEVNIPENTEMPISAIAFVVRSARVGSVDEL